MKKYTEEERDIIYDNVRKMLCKYYGCKHSDLIKLTHHELSGEVIKQMNLEELREQNDKR